MSATGLQEGTRDDQAARGPGDPRRVVRILDQRPWLACLLLLVVYVALSFLNDPMGGLGTDTGGKVATMEAMAQRPWGLDPDVGYWAAADDPDAVHHGLWYTSPIGGRFVNVTTLPMLEVGAPLYRLGGYRLALLLPMLGAVAAALAARALARRLAAPPATAWLAFGVVGLASPVVLYALDFWEHAPGLALILWGVVALLDVTNRRRAVLSAALAGAAFAAAYSMRTESLVYGFVASVVIGASLLLQRRWRRVVETGLGFGVTFLGVAALNLLLEHLALGTSLRSGRAAGTASGGGGELVVRSKEALATFTGLLPGVGQRDLVLAGLFGAALLGLAVSASRSGSTPVTRLLAALATGLFVYRLARGLGFVPGLLAAAPLAALGLVAWPTRREARLVLLIAAGALPLVWLFQFTGGAGPQWGGRYVLASGALLTVLGVLALGRIPRWVARWFVGASVVVTIAGLAWMAERSHEVGRAARDVSSFSEEAVVSGEAFWLRELGAVYEGSSTKWLSVAGPEQIDEGVDLVRAQDVESFALLDADGDLDLPEVPGYQAPEIRTYDWLGVSWRVASYRRDQPDPGSPN